MFFENGNKKQDQKTITNNLLTFLFFAFCIFWIIHFVDKLSAITLVELSFGREVYLFKSSVSCNSSSSEIAPKYNKQWQKYSNMSSFYLFNVRFDYLIGLSCFKLRVALNRYPHSTIYFTYLPGCPRSSTTGCWFACDWWFF